MSTKDGAPTPKQHLVVDGRQKRDHELAEHIRAVAHRLVEQRGVAVRRAHALIEKRKSERHRYRGPDKEWWDRWVTAHPDHGTERPPEPTVPTMEEALAEVEQDSLSEVWSDAYDIGTRELGPRQRRGLDSVWMFVHEAEAAKPAPDLDVDDRELAARAYRMGIGLLGWALYVETGRGGQIWRSSEGRPLRPIRVALRRFLGAMENTPDFQDATEVDEYERVVALKQRLQALFKQARVAYRDWKDAAGADWPIEEGKARRKIEEAVKEEMRDFIWTNRSKIDVVLKDFQRMLRRSVSPANLAISATATLLGVERHVAVEYAKEQLAKRAAAPPSRGSHIGPPSRVGRIQLEARTRRLGEQMRRRAARIRRK